jgi:pimeloyl-ACP methyl ester carboxylesterase
MNTQGLAKIIFAALLSLPSVLRAEFVSIPTVLTVHGLNAAAISCDPASVQNFAHNEACYAAASVFSKIGPAEFDDSYLDYHVNKLCGPDCAQITSFRWGGDIKDSRAAVDRLKDEIVSLGKSARLKGAPFIIISHSWGTVLAAEALAELDDYGTAEDLRVEKLVTLGSPLGTKAYSLAINSLICGQRFYGTPRRASSVAKWANYYTDRDVISSKIQFADENIAIDSDAKYSAAENELRTLSLTYDVPGYEDRAAAAIEDLKHFSLAAGTELWHAAYFTSHSLPLKSLGSTLEIDAASTFSPQYFQY